MTTDGAMLPPAVDDPVMVALIGRFRSKVMDNNPLKQILNNFQQEFSDDEICGWITEAWYDINETEPQTFYAFDQFPKTALLLKGAIIEMCGGEGFLQLRNQVSYNDAGFSANLDDKSPAYEQWLSTFTQLYQAELTRFKRKAPSFVGVGSPLRRFW